MNGLLFFLEVLFFLLFVSCGVSIAGPRLPGKGSPPLKISVTGVHHAATWPKTENGEAAAASLPRGESTHNFTKEQMRKLKEVKSSALTMYDDSYRPDVYFMANLSIGNPTRTLLVYVDLWEQSETCFTDKTVNKGSKTFTDLKQNYSSGYCGPGNNASDVVTVDSLSKTLTLRVSDSKETTSWNAFLSYFKLDGILGLNPFISRSGFYKDNHNQRSTLEELIGDMDAPVMTWWQNSTDRNVKRRDVVNTTVAAQLTLGTTRNVYCRDSWVWVPSEKNPPHHYYRKLYPVHVTSHMTDKTGADKTVVNVTLAIWGNIDPWVSPYPIEGPASFIWALGNVSNAAYNNFYERYVIKDIKTAGNLILNIGGDGKHEDLTTRQLTLTPYDYAIYSPRYKVYFLNIAKGFFTEEGIELNTSFLNNHCLGYNVKDGTVGFAFAKPKVFSEE